MGSESRCCVVVFQLVALAAVATGLWADSPTEPESRKAEVWGFDNPAFPTLDATVADESGGRPGSYLILVHLEQEELLSARVEVRDGWIVALPQRHPLRLAGRMVARTAFHILAAESPPQLQDGLLLLGGLMLQTELGAKPTAPRLVRQLKLRPRDFERHAGYATVTLQMVATPTTRLTFRRVVTRVHEGRGRRRRVVSLPTLQVPGPDGPTLTDAELMRILLGRAGTRDGGGKPW